MICMIWQHGMEYTNIRIYHIYGMVYDSISIWLSQPNRNGATYIRATVRCKNLTTPHKFGNARAFMCVCVCVWLAYIPLWTWLWNRSSATTCDVRLALRTLAEQQSQTQALCKRMNRGGETAFLSQFWSWFFFLFVCFLPPKNRFYHNQYIEC